MSKGVHVALIGSQWIEIDEQESNRYLHTRWLKRPRIKKLSTLESHERYLKRLDKSQKKGTLLKHEYDPDKLDVEACGNRWEIPMGGSDWNRLSPSRLWGLKTMRATKSPQPLAKAYPPEIMSGRALSTQQGMKVSRSGSQLSPSTPLRSRQILQLTIFNKNKTLSQNGFPLEKSLSKGFEDMQTSDVEARTIAEKKFLIQDESVGPKAKSQWSYHHNILLNLRMACNILDLVDWWPIKTAREIGVRGQTRCYYDRPRHRTNNGKLSISNNHNPTNYASNGLRTRAFNSTGSKYSMARAIASLYAKLQRSLRSRNQHQRPKQ